MACVSVIIPTYNRAELLIEALTSVLTQTYKDFEILIVDDGSTDDTVQRLKPFWNQIRYFYQPNRGPAAARNLGVKYAHGELIAFLDSDDLWAPIKLDRQIAYFQDHPDVGLVHTNFDKINHYGKTIEADVHRTNLPLRGNCFNTLIYANPIALSSVIVKRSWLQRVGLFDPQASPSEDRDLWIRLAENGCLFGHLVETLTKIRKHPTSLYKTSSKLRQIEAHVYIFKKLLERLTSKLSDANSLQMTLARQMLNKEIIRFLTECVKENQKRRAQLLLTDLIREYPWDAKYYYLLITTFFRQWSESDLSASEQM